MIGNSLRKLIEWAFFKYVVDHHLEQASLEALEEYPLKEDSILDDDDFEIVFEPDPDFVEGLKKILQAQEFDTEEEQAMYEKKYNTEH